MQCLELNTLFQQLLHYRNQAPDLQTLGPWLQRQVPTYAFPDLHQIPFAATAYTRNCIARETLNQNRAHKASTRESSQCFEAFIMRWDEQVQTPIHGHPSFAFYYVITGLFEMECFTHSSTGKLQSQGVQRFYPSDTTWHVGQAGRYDNFIHRVRCVEPGHTFHIYSEDAKKGVAL